MHRTTFIDFYIFKQMAILRKLFVPNDISLFSTGQQFEMTSESES